VASGPRGAPEPERRGAITPGRPEELSFANEYATGWAWSVYGAMDGPGARLSEQVVPGRAAAETARWNGTPCVALTLRNPFNAETFYLDPARGHALIGREFSNKGGVVLTRVTVTELLNPAPGVYYPGRGVWESFRGVTPGEPNARLTFVATRAVVNDPAFDGDEVFTIHWPPGTEVEDEVERSGST
jgi:hypothetical protein